MTEAEDRRIRLIGLDLDGTTLTSDKKLTDHTREVLEACLAGGIQVLPTTGRTQAAIPDFLKGIKGLRYMILSNGAKICDLATGEEIYSDCIPWERALTLADELEQYQTYYDFYALGRGWSERRFFDHLDRFNIEAHIETLVRTSRTPIDDMRQWIRENQASIEKFSMFFASPEHRFSAWEKLKEIPDVLVTSSVPNNLEINYHTCNKGNALLGLGKILGIPREEIMACGDGTNDLAMIKAAGLGVAMENADPVVKEAADYITLSNDEEGVAAAICKFCHLDISIPG
ncbi:MAG: HAD family phosphatase [Eubacterium sp.]|nr:HAD family phosphatase [Eubacterium sp.]